MTPHKPTQIEPEELLRALQNEESMKDVMRRHNITKEQLASEIENLAKMLQTQAGRLRVV